MRRSNLARPIPIGRPEQADTASVAHFAEKPLCFWENNPPSIASVHWVLELLHRDPCTSQLLARSPENSKNRELILEIDFQHKNNSRNLYKSHKIHFNSKLIHSSGINFVLILSTT
jgi:hypothetical protein